MSNKIKINQKEINDVTWKACDTFRGVVDPSESKPIISFLKRKNIVLL